jgi:hypothetical protein
MNLDDYIEGTFNPDNPANQDGDDFNEDDEIDINEIEVEDPEILETN